LGCRYQDKKYLVFTNERGCLLSATMPDYGVVIERRSSFSASNYPLWPPYSARRTAPIARRR